MTDSIQDTNTVDVVEERKGILADILPGGGRYPTEKLSLNNLIMFSIGTFGRDFLYNFFSMYLLSFILFTKNLTNAQFSSISIIIICARIFDAFNDPIMGGIVENTRTKWGKYKPWQLIGSVLTGLIIVLLFSVKLEGWAYIGFLAFGYFMFSITFTMNDISYWGMMPTLTSNEHDRNKLMSLAQLVASGGGGLVGLMVPMLTAGQFTLPGGAPTAYMMIAICAAVLMVGFQLFTIFGVKEKILPANTIKTKRLSVKEMFKTISKNDQLLWCTIVLLLWCTGPAVVGSGLSMSYIYFEFGYEGGMFTSFGIGFAITSTLFTVVYPWLAKKWGRNRVLYSSVGLLVLGYLIMLLFGLVIPSGDKYYVLKFTLMTLANAVVGMGSGFYMIMVVNIANTVEYNEWKTGKREEGLIFSLRPFTAKLGSALTQGIVMAVYILAGVLTYTNQISDLENQEAGGIINSSVKLEQIGEVIASVSQESKTILLFCMCLIPIVFILVAGFIYKKKCFLNETKLIEIIAETEERKRAEERLAKQAENISAAECLLLNNANPSGVEEVLAMEMQNVVLAIESTVQNDEVESPSDDDNLNE